MTSAEGATPVAKNATSPAGKNSLSSLICSSLSILGAGEERRKKKKGRKEDRYLISTPSQPQTKRAKRKEEMSKASQRVIYLFIY